MKRENTGSVGRPVRIGRLLVVLLAVVATVREPGPLALAESAQAQARASLDPPAGDVMRGWRVFYDKRCVDCHAIWDEGGRVGPDLGRARTGRLSGGQLAGVMWNHIPKMLGWMKQMGHSPAALTREQMADLFALIAFVRQLDELGDPVRGEDVLRNKGCSECHSTDASEGAVGPDLAKWGRYANPIVWAQLMWEHAPVMEEAMKRSGMDWPKLQGSDLVHIVAYVRSTGTNGERTYLRPGAADRGQRLFLEKKCDQCHPGTGPDLAVADLPSSMSALASRMWNHSPEMTRVMREQDVDRQPVDPQELADILAYVLALSTRDRGGDPARGKWVFAQKGCTQCHESEDMIESSGPPVAQLSGDATPVNMAAAMWNHGETMLDRMTEAGISWPVFDDKEMLDLLAHLRAVGASNGEPAAPGGSGE